MFSRERVCTSSGPSQLTGVPQLALTTSAPAIPRSVLALTLLLGLTGRLVDFYVPAAPYSYS